MSLRALGRQFISTLNRGVVQPVKAVNRALKEDERRKLHEAPLTRDEEMLEFE